MRDRLVCRVGQTGTGQHYEDPPLSANAHLVSRAAYPSDLTKSSRVLNRLGHFIRGRRSDILAGKVGEETRVSAAQRTGAAEAVDLAGVSQGAGASGVGARVGAAEELASAVGVDRVDDVLEDVALGDDLAAGVDLEGMALDVVPVVVDGVEESVSGNLGAATGGVVDVVVLECDKLRRGSMKG
jgi:hypothetical protein